MSLTDNVTAQLNKIRSSIANIGGGPAGLGLERMKRQTEDVTKHVKGLAAGFEGGSNAALGMAKSFGLATAGVLAVGVAAVKSLENLGAYSDKMTALGVAAQRAGTNAAQFQSMVETFARSGVDAGRAASNIAGLAQSMGEINKVNSQLRQDLLRNLEGEKRSDMELLLGGLGRAANDPAAFANTVKDALENIYANVLRDTNDPQRARIAQQQFAARLGAPTLTCCANSSPRPRGSPGKRWRGASSKRPSSSRSQPTSARAGSRSAIRSMRWPSRRRRRRCVRSPPCSRNRPGRFSPPLRRCAPFSRRIGCGRWARTSRRSAMRSLACSTI